MKLSKMVTRALEEIESEAVLQLTDDQILKKQYGIKNVPGLVINEQLVCEGKVLTVREIKKLLLA